MTEKELKKLNRKQLLELLLKQTQRAESLELQLREAEEKIAELSLKRQKTELITQVQPVIKLEGNLEGSLEGVLEAAMVQYLKNLDEESKSKKREHIKDGNV